MRLLFKGFGEFVGRGPKAGGKEQTGTRDCSLQDGCVLGEERMRSLSRIERSEMLMQCVRRLSSKTKVPGPATGSSSVLIIG